MQVRESTREKYSERFKTKFDSYEEFIEHMFYREGEVKQVEDHLEMMELEELRREYRNSIIHIDGEPLSPKSDYVGFLDEEDSIL